MTKSLVPSEGLPPEINGSGPSDANTKLDEQISALVSKPKRSGSEVPSWSMGESSIRKRRGGDATAPSRRVRRSSVATWLRQSAVLIGSISRVSGNEKTYNTPSVVRDYAVATGLQEPERAIRDRLAPSIVGKNMLDIGVGGGRTTPAFSSLVKSYVGLDYSPAMIEACQARFLDKFDNVTFTVGDVREMHEIANCSFDFVLFSFNGLDYIEHEDRLRALREIHRICRPGGFFCFSSHNLYNASKFLLARNTDSSAPRPNLLKLSLLRACNPTPKKLGNMSFALLNDGAHGFRLRTYYVTPSAQLRQLEQTGFELVEVHGLDGKEVPRREVDQARDAWLYYTSRRRN